MFLKELREIINEADTPPLGTDSNIQKEIKTTNKPKAVIAHIKKTSDGVGAEAYKMSNSIAVTLKTDLLEYYHIASVKASNNRVTITADVAKMKNGQITSKLTGDIVSAEILLDTIQQIIIADIGANIDDFSLVGPKKVANGVFVITIFSNVEKLQKTEGI